MMRPSFKRPLLLCSLVLTLGLSACGSDKPADNSAVDAKPAPLELAPVDVVTVRQQTLSGGYAISGSLQPVVQTTVQSRVGAEVNEVLVREGMRVEKGQLLARLSIQDLSARLKQAEAGLAAAKVEAELSRLLTERNRKLYEKKYFSEVDYQRSEGETAAKMENVRAQQALVDIARKAENDAQVKAPISGLIARRYIEPGSSINLDGRLFDIVDLGKMELSVPVPATDIALVKVGQAVNFTVSGFGDRQFNGQVVRINPVADPSTRAISVYVQVNNADMELKGGMYARGEIAVGQAGEGLMVPVEALHGTAEGKPWVFLIRNDKLEKQDLQTGARNDRQGTVAVKSGLQEGDRVVVVRLNESAVGQPVNLSK